VLGGNLDESGTGCSPPSMLLGRASAEEKLRK
jgi:hypothetical protein